MWSTSARILQCRYGELRAAVVAVQAQWRARQARWALTQHRAACAVQAYWRMWAVQRMRAMWHAAATRIQVSLVGDFRPLLHSDNTFLFSMH